MKYRITEVHPKDTTPEHTVGDIVEGSQVSDDCVGGVFTGHGTGWFYINNRIDGCTATVARIEPVSEVAKDERKGTVTDLDPAAIAKLVESYTKLGPRGRLVLASVAERLVLGAKQYGDFDTRDWRKEANEELLDFLVYETVARLSPAVVTFASAAPVVDTTGKYRVTEIHPNDNDPAHEVGDLVDPPEPGDYDVVYPFNKHGKGWCYVENARGDVTVARVVPADDPPAASPAAAPRPAYPGKGGYQYLSDGLRYTRFYESPDSEPVLVSDDGRLPDGSVWVPPKGARVRIVWRLVDDEPPYVGETHVVNRHILGGDEEPEFGFEGLPYSYCCRVVPADAPPAPPAPPVPICLNCSGHEWVRDCEFGGIKRCPDCR